MDPTLGSTLNQHQHHQHTGHMNLQQAATINVGHGHPHSQGVNVDDMFHQETGLDDEDDEDDGDGESSLPSHLFFLPSLLSHILSYGIH